MFVYRYYNNKLCVFMFTLTLVINIKDIIASKNTFSKSDFYTCSSVNFTDANLNMKTKRINVLCSYVMFFMLSYIHSENNLLASGLVGTRVGS